MLMIRTIATTKAFGSSETPACRCQRHRGVDNHAADPRSAVRAMRECVASGTTAVGWGGADRARISAAFLIVDGRFSFGEFVESSAGALLPLSLAALWFLIMITWRNQARGRTCGAGAAARNGSPADRVFVEISGGVIPRVQGTTVL